MSKTRVTVSAAANIALIKYWGKLEKDGNQPATASLSVGLEDLRTRTTLTLTDEPTDIIDFDGNGNGANETSEANEAAKQRIRRFLDLVRQQHEVASSFHISTANNFPTGTGLASSASGFAALAIGLNELLNLKLSRQVLSKLARSGSGSAARSVYGGWVEVIPADDAYAIRVMSADHWPMSVIVAITNEAEKTIGSTEAMKLTASTSPYYRDWLKSHMSDMNEAKLAIADRDFEKLGDITEHNCLKMHGAIMTSRPPVLYWLPATLAVMQEVQRLRRAGTPAFFTIDAGSQVKVLCPVEFAATVNQALSSINGVSRTLQTIIGGEPQIQVQ